MTATETSNKTRLPGIIKKLLIGWFPVFGICISACPQANRNNQKQVRHMSPIKNIKVLSITIAVILTVPLVLKALQDTDDCGSAAALAVLWVIAAFDPLCPYAIGWQIATWMSLVSFTIILIASVCKCIPIKRILIFYSIMPIIYIVVTMILDTKLHPGEFPANIDKQIYKALACLIVCRISCSYVRYYIGSAWHGVLALLLYLSMGIIVIITQEYK